MVQATVASVPGLQEPLRTIGLGQLATQEALVLELQRPFCKPGLAIEKLFMTLGQLPKAGQPHPQVNP